MPEELTAREIELLVGESMPGYEGVMWRLSRALDVEVFRGTARTDVYQAVGVLLASLSIEVVTKLTSEPSEAERVMEGIWALADQIRKRSSKEILGMRLARNGDTSTDRG